MRLGSWQFDVRRGDIAANTTAVERGLRLAADRQLDLLVLPEMWPTSFDSADRARADDAVAASEAAVERVARLAAELGLAVAGSSYGAALDGGLPRNRFSLWSAGQRLLSYDKVHLFSKTAEHLAFSAGQQPPPVADLAGVKIAGLICYDLRFSPVLQAAREGGAEVLLVPAQWPSPRASQWHALLAGRAVETQAFVVGANRVGAEPLGRRGRELVFGGDSTIVAPDGEALARSAADGAERLIWADLELAQVREMRSAVRVAEDRRADLYPVWRTGRGDAPGPN